MARMVCTMCGFVYDEARGSPSQGLAPGTAWDEVPEGYRCKMCGSPRTVFRREVRERFERS